MMGDSGELRELIRINQPFLGKEEIDSAVDVLRSGVMTDKSGMGPRVLEFERSFAKYVVEKHALAVLNGTAAIACFAPTYFAKLLSNSRTLGPMPLLSVSTPLRRTSTAESISSFPRNG